MENQVNSNFYSQKNIHIGAWQSHEPSEIVMLLADVNYTQIHFANGKRLTVATPMKTLESRLASCNHFFRTHKSFLVNLHFIKKTDSLVSDEYVEMQNNFRVAISRRRKVAFVKKIKELDA